MFYVLSDGPVSWAISFSSQFQCNVSDCPSLPLLFITDEPAREPCLQINVMFRQRDQTGPLWALVHGFLSPVFHSGEINGGSRSSEELLWSPWPRICFPKSLPLTAAFQAREEETSFPPLPHVRERTLLSCSLNALMLTVICLRRIFRQWPLPDRFIWRLL